MGQLVSDSVGSGVSGSVGLSVSRSIISQLVGQSVCLLVTLPLPSVCLSVRLSVKLKVSQVPVSTRRDRHEILCMMSILIIVVFSCTCRSRFYSFQQFSSITITCFDRVNCDDENSFITRDY